MPMDFPASPSVGQTYNGYVWSGVAWESANPQTISLTGQVIVANQAARDALYPSPVQGNAVFRNDLGVEEIYYGLYNVSTNPGGRDTAGWYINDRTSGLIPVVPSSVVIATGSGSANALGQVSFTGATAVSLNNVFSSAYLNYSFILRVASNTAATQINLRLRSSGTDNSTNSYGQTQHYSRVTGAVQTNSGAPATQGGLMTISAGTSGDMYFTGTIMAPAVTGKTAFGGTGIGSDATSSFGITTQDWFGGTNAFDGFSLFIGSGTFTGSVQVFGYND